MFCIVDEALNFHTIALPSEPPEARILEFFEAYKHRIAAFGWAFCFFMIFFSLHIYR